jgi:ubiquinone biosynthesis protein UbiJ
MAWLKFIESAGNHVLALDPDFLQQLEPFYKKTFRIEISEPDIKLDLRPCPDGFIIEAAGENTPCVVLKGSLWAFMKLAREGSHSSVFADGRIHMRGDAELGQSFQRVFGSLQIDWEEVTSRFLGDMAARNIHRALDGVSTWFRQSSRHFKENSGEFMQQEVRLTPSKVESDDLSDKIDSLRSDTARLEARLTRLQRALFPQETKNNA